LSIFSVLREASLTLSLFMSLLVLRGLPTNHSEKEIFLVPGSCNPPWWRLVFVYGAFCYFVLLLPGSSPWGFGTLIAKEVDLIFGILRHCTGVLWCFSLLLSRLQMTRRLLFRRVANGLNFPWPVRPSYGFSCVVALADLRLPRNSALRLTLLAFAFSSHFSSVDFSLEVGSSPPPADRSFCSQSFFYAQDLDISFSINLPIAYLKPFPLDGLSLFWTPLLVF